MDLKKHYQQLFEKHGNTSQSVQYTDKTSQFRRFEILSQIDPAIKSVTDFGCGLAHLYEFMKTKPGLEKYLGLDFVPEFIGACKEQYKNDPKASFQVFDIYKDDLTVLNEYVFLSGVFNNKMDNNKDFMLSSIRKMYEKCTKGVAFNAMSTYVDYFAEDLYYSNPLEVFDFCKKEITRKVVLRHDYLVKENSIPFEYAIYLYK